MKNIIAQRVDLFLPFPEDFVSDLRCLGVLELVMSGLPAIFIPQLGQERKEQ